MYFLKFPHDRPGFLVSVSYIFWSVNLSTYLAGCIWLIYIISEIANWYLLPYVLSELPPEIITKMQDVTIAKGEKAIFEIELTKGDALVRWFKDEKELQFSEHIQLSIDGKRQKLKIYNSELEDSGVYSCQVGEQTSAAKLRVEG